MINLKISLKKFAVFFVNTVLSFAFFFSLKKYVLRAVGVRVGKDFAWHYGVKLFDFGGLVIGDNCTINYGCFVDNRGGVKIGNNVNISHCVKIYSLGHNIDHPLAGLVAKPVEICDDAWIFPNAIIMPGVKIGRGAVVYPGAVVTKSISEYAVVGGNPAKLIKYRNKSIDYKIDFRVWFSI